MMDALYADPSFLSGGLMKIVNNPSEQIWINGNLLM